jgi:hypothetical protein
MKTTTQQRYFTTRAAISVVLLLAAPVLFAQTSYYTGQGGKGTSIAVLQPEGANFAKDDQWLCSYTQGILTDYFSKFSAMTVTDKQNVDKILDEQAAQYSGNYSETQQIKIGNLTAAKFGVVGTITKIPSGQFHLSLGVNDLEKNVRVNGAAFNRTCAEAQFKTASVLGEAAVELLGAMGVQLTEAGKQALLGGQTVNVNAQSAVAKGITAQRSGATAVEVMAYMYQAIDYDAALAEANARLADINSRLGSLSTPLAVAPTGNIREDAQAQIAAYKIEQENKRIDEENKKTWTRTMEDCEKYFANFIKNANPPFELVYSTIRPGELNKAAETMSLLFDAVLSPLEITWYGAVEKTVNNLAQKLQETGRAKDWGLDTWPQKTITTPSPFTSQKRDIRVDAELLDDKGKVIGKANGTVTGGWTVREPTKGAKAELHYSADVGAFKSATIQFTQVKVSAITDTLTIRIAKINGVGVEGGIMPVSTSDMIIPTGITTIDNMAYISNKLKNILITAGITTIGDRAFENNLLTSVVIPRGVKTIGAQAFAYNRLTSVVIPDRVTTIGARAFANNLLTSVVIPDSFTTIGGGAFAYNRLTSVVIHKGVKTIGDRAFANNQLTSVVIHKGVTTTGAYAFENNRLTSVVIPDSVTTIGARAFVSNQLTSVVIHKGVKTIGSTAFENNQLTSVVIPDSVTTIGSGAFLNNQLTRITIGANVKIENSIFDPDFWDFYQQQKRQAGTYIYRGKKWSLKK